MAQNKAQRRRNGRLPGPLLTTEPETSRKQLSWREPRSPARPRVEGSGRTVPGMPDPQPQAPHQPTRHLSRPHGRRPDPVGPTSLAPSLAPGGLAHASVSTVPRVQGQGRPPGQAIQEGSVMAEAAVSFAGNLTDQPEVRYTDSGIRPGQVPGGRLWSAGAGGVVLHRGRVARPGRACRR